MNEPEQLVLMAVGDLELNRRMLLLQVAQLQERIEELEQQLAELNGRPVHA